MSNLNLIYRFHQSGRRETKEPIQDSRESKVKKKKIRPHHRIGHKREKAIKLLFKCRQINIEAFLF